MTRQPVRLGDALQSFLRDSGLEDRVEEAAVLPEWAARVGPAIAGVTTPVSVSRGTLLVAVGTSGWLMELRLMERDILRRLNEGRERGRIEHIRFVMADGEDEGSPAARRPRRPRKRSS
jgi:predicted nucleic acid-binding Zn ribbon protein